MNVNSCWSSQDMLFKAWVSKVYTEREKVFRFCSSQSHTPLWWHCFWQVLLSAHSISKIVEETKAHYEENPSFPHRTILVQHLSLVSTLVIDKDNELIYLHSKNDFKIESRCGVVTQYWNYFERKWIRTRSCCWNFYWACYNSKFIFGIFPCYLSNIRRARCAHNL